MCLAVPSKVVRLLDDNLAAIDVLGVSREVSLDLMPEAVFKGDYVLVHVGYAIGKISEKEARETLDLYRVMLEGVDGRLERPG
jgi:hydrogenase expression/formation protein HypC